MCQSNYDVNHKALSVSQETRRRQNDYFRSHNIATPADGDDMTPIPYVNYEMPPISDDMFYGYPLPSFGQDGQFDEDVIQEEDPNFTSTGGGEGDPPPFFG